MKSMRGWLADRLMIAARRLDPTRPTVEVQRSGGWVIHLGGVPLAQIGPGQINNQRPVHR